MIDILKQNSPEGFSQMALNNDIFDKVDPLAAMEQQPVKEDNKTKIVRLETQLNETNDRLGSIDTKISGIEIIISELDKNFDRYFQW